jgi:hypothetical protein
MMGVDESGFVRDCCAISISDFILVKTVENWLRLGSVPVSDYDRVRRVLTATHAYRRQLSKRISHNLIQVLVIPSLLQHLRRMFLEGGFGFRICAQSFHVGDTKLTEGPVTLVSSAP